MLKEDCIQCIYEVNDFYFRLHNGKTFIDEQINFIYYKNQDKWYVYGSDFNGKKIDIAILENNEVDEIKNWNEITKSKLFRYIISDTKRGSNQSLIYQTEILKNFLIEFIRAEKLNSLLNKNNSPNK